MLWLCLHFPQLPAEALGLRDPLEAVTDCRGARRWLITAAPGLRAGLPLAEALALQPALRAHTRKPAAERAALRALAHGAYRYGSPVTAAIEEPATPGRVPRALLWIEVGASRRLFGGLAALRAALDADLVALGQQAQFGLAPTRSAAALLACAGDERPVDEAAGLERRLAALPLTLLPWPDPVLEALAGMGLRRLGALWALPRAALARRIGPERLLDLDRLLGHVGEPLRPITPPPQFRRRFELAGETGQLEGLLFPLRRLSVELQHWLRARETGVRSLVLECEHAQQRRTRLGLRFVAAHRDAGRIFDALRERLNREPPAEAVRALRLEVSDLAPVASGQGDLFSGETDEALRWSETVERLLARLGESALWTPAVVADHRPERTTAQRPASAGAGRSAQALRSAAAPPPHGAAAQKQPLWLLPTPVPLPGVPAPAGEPVRIESGWWDGADARRDYHTVDWQQARAWVFRDHASGRWYLHGWWG